MALGAAVWAGDAGACTPVLPGEGVRVMRSATHAVAWRADPPTIPVGAHFGIELAVCTADGGGRIERVAVDAGMPAHRHGMNYRATVSVRGEGRYRAEGLMFHMPGRWRLTVELRGGAGVERLSDDVTVE
jgi:hypothetical protein